VVPFTKALGNSGNGGEDRKWASWPKLTHGWPIA
jgi:hypothetical protein